MDKRGRITYKIIEAAVNRSIHYIEEDGNRGVRNIVDLGAHFAKGQFQKDFFSFAQEILNNDNSAYYTFVRNLVSNVDGSILKKFGINLGYNCWTYGAKEIRKNEKMYGYNIPWTIIFDFCDPAPSMTQDAVSRLLFSGEMLGIFSANFFVGHNVSVLKWLIAALHAHQDGAYSIFVDPSIINCDIIDSANDAGNVLIVLSMDAARNMPDTMHVSKMLFDRKSLFGIYSTYDNSNIEWVMSRVFAEQALKTQCAVAYLIEKKPLYAEEKQHFLQYIRKIKNEDISTFFLIDFYRDMTYINNTISADDCFLSIDGSGQVTTSHKNTYPKLNAKYHSLSEILNIATPQHNMP